MKHHNVLKLEAWVAEEYFFNTSFIQTPK